MVGFFEIWFPPKLSLPTVSFAVAVAAAAAYYKRQPDAWAEGSLFVIVARKGWKLRPVRKYPMGGNLIHGDKDHHSSNRSLTCAQAVCTNEIWG